jgi:hypothetical protein
MGKRVEQHSYISSLGVLLLSTLKSIRWWFLLVILVDLAFYAGVYGMASVAASEIRGNYDALSLPDPSIPQEISPAEAQAMLSQMKAFYYGTMGMLAAVAIAVIAWWSVCKGIIWCITLKESITLSTLWRFFMLNLAWLGCWMLLLALLAYALDLAKATYLFLGVLGLFSLLTTSIYTFFIPSPSFASFKHGFLISLKKFHLLALPAVLLFAAYVAVAKLFMVFPPSYSVQFSLMAFTLLFAAFGRAYLAAVLTHVTFIYEKN